MTQGMVIYALLAAGGVCGILACIVALLEDRLTSFGFLAVSAMSFIGVMLS